VKVVANVAGRYTGPVRASALAARARPATGSESCVGVNPGWQQELGDMTELFHIAIWPVTVIVIVLILRKPLARLVESTRKLKYKDLELEFRKNIEQIQAEAKEVLPEAPDKAKSTVEIDLYGLAQVSPTAAVVEAWKAIEASAKNLIASRGHKLDYDVERPFKLIQDVLVKGKIIDPRHGKILDDLRQLRNKVVHASGFTLSSEQAVQYIDLSIKLRQYLERLQ
jgi:hypothetical protein